jgi:hypothetical protein
MRAVSTRRVSWHRSQSRASHQPVHELLSRVASAFNLTLLIVMLAILLLTESNGFMHRGGSAGAKAFSLHTQRTLNAIAATWQYVTDHHHRRDVRDRRLDAAGGARVDLPAPGPSWRWC